MSGKLKAAIIGPGKYRYRPADEGHAKRLDRTGLDGWY